MSGAPRSERAALGALVFLAVATAAWWALALWPASDSPPEWLARARWVCFNAGPDGLPDASGWLLLVGQPLGMLAVLMSVWGREVRAGLRAAAASTSGRTAIAAGASLLAAGALAGGVRVVGIANARETATLDVSLPPDTYPRLDRPAPALSLVDQNGARLDLARLQGRPALVTFAFGSCQTVCPAVVRQTLAVQDEWRRRARAGEVPAASVPRVVIVSLDPWRDTPSRLSHLASHWKLGPDAYVLTGSVEAVESVLDAWSVARRRDEKTGDVSHPALVYIVDGRGSIAYATRGGTDELNVLLGRVRIESKES